MCKIKEIIDVYKFLRDRYSSQSSDHSSTRSGSASTVQAGYKHVPYGGISHLIKGNSTASLLRFTRALHTTIASDQQSLLHPLNERAASDDANTVIGKKINSKTSFYKKHLF